MLFSCTHLHPRGTTTVQTYAKYRPYPNALAHFAHLLVKKGNIPIMELMDSPGCTSPSCRIFKMFGNVGCGNAWKNPNRKIGVAAGKILDFSENMSTDDVGLTFRTSYRFSGITETTSRQTLLPASFVLSNPKTHLHYATMLWLDPEFWCRLGHGHIGNLPQILNMYLVYIHIYIYVIMDRYKTHQTHIHLSHPSWHLKISLCCNVLSIHIKQCATSGFHCASRCHSFFPFDSWSNKRSTHRQSWAEQPCDSTTSTGNHSPQKKFMKYTKVILSKSIKKLVWI